MKSSEELLRDADMFQDTLVAVLKKELQPVVRITLLKAKPFLTPKDVEDLYEIPEASLRTMRSRGGGPRYHQKSAGSPVRYTHEDIPDYMRATRTRG